jgi:hypothetical protein
MKMKKLRFYMILWLPVIIFMVLFSWCQPTVSEQENSIISNQMASH